MAKKSAKAPASNRQAKIQAASASSGSGVNKIVVATVVAVVAIIAVVTGVIWSEQSKKSDIRAGGNALPAGVSELGAGYPGFQDVTAADGAPTIDIYEDFQCPACQLFETQLGPTLEQLATEGKATVVYHVKDFLDDKLGNTSSRLAGTAAFCAADQGKFQEFHDAAYAGQPVEGAGFTVEGLTAMAEQVGITGDGLSAWSDCVKAGKYDDYIASVEEQSAKDSVFGTPTIRINGTDWTFTGQNTPEEFRAAVEAATT